MWHDLEVDILSEFVERAAKPRARLYEENQLHHMRGVVTDVYDMTLAERWLRANTDERLRIESKAMADALSMPAPRKRVGDVERKRIYRDRFRQQINARQSARRSDPMVKMTLAIRQREYRARKKAAACGQ